MAIFRDIKHAASAAILLLAACSTPYPASPPFADALGLSALSADINASVYGQIAAVVVSQHGNVVFEDYFRGGAVDTFVDMRSVGKSLTAMAVGAAMLDGAITRLDMPVIPAFPDHQPLAHMTEDKRAMTLRDLMAMQSPLACSDWRDSPGNEERMYRTRDWTAFALNLPLDPGFRRDASGAGRFSYCTAGVFLVGQMVERATGQPFDAYVTARLLSPLGVGPVVWRRSPSGEVQSAGQIRLRARDSERLGRLVLQDGVWQGERLLPSGWVERMLTPRSEVMGDLRYGLLWWDAEFGMPGGAQTQVSFMLGNGGNIVAVLPDHDAVIVVQATNYNQPGDFDLSRLLIEDHILPALTRGGG
ncbi:CubicO group peptidase (beta-lactamase class C family) [Rubricella aquisinus]|uniref:CubicO group peptidase (Beta-lactamase class C family) n=1 Tax=Rubricella aquisinus TaxID=2028108 RepID=A0A840WNB8_9RHOB|nr:serine hydrolase [Rubricella aquisinus]MBB5515152.1 CubicO group peptidase (beta-lactamase class C family) [Rubricella aquisinus]